MRAHARVLPLESLRAARVGTQYHSVSKLEFICAIPTLRDYRLSTGRPLDAAPRPALPLPPAPRYPARCGRHAVMAAACARVRGVQRAASSAVVISLNPDNRLRPWRAARGGSEPRSGVEAGACGGDSTRARARTAHRSRTVDPATADSERSDRPHGDPRTHRDRRFNSPLSTDSTPHRFRHRLL
jgi:hypothetical protein